MVLKSSEYALIKLTKNELDLSNCTADIRAEYEKFLIQQVEYIFEVSAELGFPDNIIDEMVNILHIESYHLDNKIQAEQLLRKFFCEMADV